MLQDNESLAERIRGQGVRMCPDGILEGQWTTEPVIFQAPAFPGIRESALNPSARSSKHQTAPGRDKRDHPRKMEVQITSQYLPRYLLDLYFNHQNGRL